MFLATAEKLALVFFAQEREITLTWSIAEKYMGHFSCAGTQCSGILVSAENHRFNQSKSKLWVKNLHQHLIVIFYTTSIANCLAIL